MALPTLSKTWQFNVNNQTTAQGSVLADCRKTLRAIKNAMIGFLQTLGLFATRATPLQQVQPAMELIVGLPIQNACLG